MILPVKYLWEQLDGPQIRAFSNALFEYMKGMFDDKLDYFNKMSVETAGGDHLTFLGILANFVRPVITVPDKDFFFLTEGPEHNNSHGLAALSNRNIGGRLTGIEGATTEARPLSTEYYRALLYSYIEGLGELGGLELLDDICYNLSKLDNPLEVPFYTFEFMQGDDIPTGRAPGDVYLNIGTLDDWVNPMQAYAVLRGLAQSTYAPTPQLFISIDTTITVPTPTASLSPGIYSGTQYVELACALSTAVIHYTTDGTTPSAATPAYVAGQPITISQSTLLRARAIAAGYNSSPIVDFNYTIQ